MTHSYFLELHEAISTNRSLKEDFNEKITFNMAYKEFDKINQYLELDLRSAPPPNPYEVSSKMIKNFREIFQQIIHEDSIRNLISKDPY